MKKLIFAIFLLPITLLAQGYTSYFTGNTTNISTTPEFGVCMMGGASENDNAMMWLLQKANGGDVVVIRSSGGNGYNDYMYSGLGVTVNSVETLVITSEAGATNPYVLDKVANAEMIWFAGGDQYNYVSFFKDNALEAILNAHINVKHAPIGGISAGMAILGSKYFSAQNGSVTTAEVLANPYNSKVTIGLDDFLEVPFMNNVITDTHYDYYDRKGRQTAFMGRLKHDGFGDVNGIACNEYVAVCLDAAGRAYVYGDYPNYQEFAYFLQPNCMIESTPEVCETNTALTWNQNGQAVKVYKVPGTMNGNNYFDLNEWKLGLGSGGSWEDWSVVNGVFNAVAGIAPDCLLATEEFDMSKISVAPNPFHDYISIAQSGNVSVYIYNANGQIVFKNAEFTFDKINTTSFSNGLYFIRIEKEGKTITHKLLKI